MVASCVAEILRLFNGADATSGLTRETLSIRASTVCIEMTCGVHCRRPKRPWTFRKRQVILPHLHYDIAVTEAPRLVAEAFITALALIALFWLAWVGLWLLEQRW